jgi:hypothetical protein
LHGGFSQYRYHLQFFLPLFLVNSLEFVQPQGNNLINVSQDKKSVDLSSPVFQGSSYRCDANEKFDSGVHYFEVGLIYKSSLTNRYKWIKQSSEAKMFGSDLDLA